MANGPKTFLPLFLPSFSFSIDSGHTPLRAQAQAQAAHSIYVLSPLKCSFFASDPIPRSRSRSRFHFLAFIPSSPLRGRAVLGAFVEQEALSGLHHRFLAIPVVTALGTRSTSMASIPLLCCICPKRPQFSDISHLLTHVGSKGHLSHYFKAQVRSRQEPAVRQQLDTYDRWYAKYQIEKLLSQRMVLKESKEMRANGRPHRRGAPPPVNSSLAPTRATRTANRPQWSADNITAGVIDPQLARGPLLSPELCAGSPPLMRESPSGELASRHRAYIPQMWQKDSQGPSKTPSLDPCVNDPLVHLARKRYPGTNGGNDFHPTREHSPTEMTYPDPSTLSETSQVRPFQHSSAGGEASLQSTATESEAGKSTIDEAGQVQSPVLKGIQWPGMNIFDSANPEAQRKRNQKKTTSIMVQMELNSSAVEPLERIFWPEGNLKKERVITGMVESSPMKEESPRPKRRRQAPSRTVLGDLSTNDQSRTRRPPAIKPFSKVTESQDADLGDLSKRSPAKLDFPSFENPGTKEHGVGVINDEDIEWKLNAGLPTEQGDDFAIFLDEVKHELDNPLRGGDTIPTTTDYPPIPSNYADAKDDGLDFINHDFTFTPDLSDEILASRTNRHFSTNMLAQGDCHLSAGLPSWMTTSDKENLEPILDHRGRVDEEARQFRPERITQRYFYVNETHRSEFYDFLPSQMEFGGLGNSSFFGSSRNPLIPPGQR